MFRHFFASACLVCLSLLFVYPSDSAAEVRLSQLHHKAWRANEGAPSNVSALAQTSDGYLWLGTVAGLYRFDGLRFESLESAYRVSLLSSEVSALLATPDGGLWIGYRFGGASHLRAGKITHYRPGLKRGEALAGGSVRQFAQGKDGTVWANTGPLNVFRNNRWELAHPAMPRDGDSGVLVDRRGGVWAGFADGLYWRANGSAAFTKVSDRSGITFFAEAPDGTIWAMTNRLGLARFHPVDGRSLEVAKHIERAIPSGRPMFDRQGNLWCATGDYALSLIPRSALLASDKPAQEFVENFSEKNGLSGGLVARLLQDREGNVWVATGNGIDRFRETRVYPMPVPAPEGPVMLTMAAADDGKVWVGDWKSGLYLAGKVVEPIDEKVNRIIFMYRAPSGRVWMGNPYELWLHERGSLKRLGWPDDARGLLPQAAVEDGNGGLWVSLLRHGVFRLHEGTWEDKSALFGPKTPAVNVMARDGEGGFWAAHDENKLLRVNGESIRRYGAADGLDLGPITAISASRQRVWLGGVDGVIGYDGRRFDKLKGRGAHVFKGVSGIVVTDNGDLWMNGDDGIVRIASAELASWNADRSHGVDYEKLDYLDGVVGKAPHIRPLPSALQASDGRLWFTAGRNLTVVEPSRVIRNALPPPVVITRVDIDGDESSPGAPIVLEPEARRIEIGFAGLSLSIPERNRYRYRLAGVDRDWVAGDHRRSVAYTNLAPGRYLFEVSASNNDGVWSTKPAQLGFEVLPMFYETWWFRCGVILLLGLALWLAYHLRVKVLTRRISDRLESQQMERVRIARELHDTLLQGVGSLSLVMRRAINKVEREHPVVPFLSDGLKQAESVIAEGRQRVARLRVDAAAGDAMVDELGILGQELTVDSKTRFSLTVRGDIRQLNTEVAEECRMIAREAIWNAVQHADAKTISLAIEFGRRSLVLRVRDDGPGLPPEVLRAGCKEGHWGVPGMRERACRIGGQLEILGVQGTTIVLKVPASLAYRGARQPWDVTA